MSLHLILSYVLVAITWTSLLLILLYVWLLFRNPFYYYHKVYDQCTPSSAKYRYIIRVIFADHKPTFQMTRSSVWFEVLYREKTVAKINLGPPVLLTCAPYQQMAKRSICRLILYRKEPFEGITHVVANHNGNGQIVISSVEIQRMDENEANIVYIGGELKAMDAGNASIHQKFPASNREPQTIESELKPHAYPNLMELIVLFFFATNLILFLNIFLIPCPEDIVCNDYDGGLVSSIYAGLSSGTATAILFVILCLLCRFCIKKPLIRSQQNSKLIAIRYAFLLVIIALGLTLGILAAVLAANGLRFPDSNPEQKLPHEVFWMFADGIGILIFYLLWMPCMSMIGQCVGFFSDPEDRLKPRGPAPIAEDLTSVKTEVTESNPDYYKELLRGKTKVKSISQYKGLQQSTDRQKSSEKTTASEGLQIDAQTGKPSQPSQESVGKSSKQSSQQTLQQSTGKSSQKSIPKSSQKSSQQQSQQQSQQSSQKVSEKSTQKSSQKSSQKPSQSKSAAKTVESETTQSGSVKKSASQDSIGTKYYDEIMKKNTKVKSISQY